VVCNNCAPVIVSWILNITDRIFPSLHPDLEIVVSSWISSPLITSCLAISWSKNLGINCKSSNPNEHENIEIFDIFNSLDNKFNLKSEFWVYSQVEEAFDNNLNQDKKVECNGNHEDWIYFNVFQAICASNKHCLMRIWQSHNEIGSENDEWTSVKNVVVVILEIVSNSTLFYLKTFNQKHRNIREHSATHAP